MADVGRKLADDKKSLDKRALYRELGRFFREHREAAGLSSHEVAVCLELKPPSVLLQYESGEVDIPLDEIFALTNFLNIPPEDLLTKIHLLFTTDDENS